MKLRAHKRMLGSTVYYGRFAALPKANAGHVTVSRYYHASGKRDGWIAHIEHDNGPAYPLRWDTLRAARKWFAAWPGVPRKKGR